MKKMLMENLWLKLVSVVLAAIMWVLILYTYDPAATADFNLNVNVINGDKITSLGKVYEVIEGNSVTIRVKANSSLIKTLRSTDFEATADLSKLSPTSHANIDVVCKRANNIDIRFIGKVKFLEVKLEDLVTKQFPVTVEKRGEAEEGFFIGNAVPKPNFITVSGGKSSINKIKAVKVRVDASKSQTSFSTTSEPKAYDIDGYEITTGSLSFSSPSVDIMLNIFKTKEVPVLIRTMGRPYMGYAIEGIAYEPKTIKVAGTDERLKRINKVIIPIEVDGEITSVESSIRLIDYISDGIYLEDSESVVNVNTKIVRLSTKELSLPIESIKLLNQREDFVYETFTEDEIKLSIKGLKADLEKITEEKIEASLDFSEITEPGEYKLKLKLNEIRGITLPTAPVLTYDVKEKKEEEAEKTEEEVKEKEKEAEASEEKSSVEEKKEEGSGS